MDGEVWAQMRRKIGRSFYHMRYFVLESELLAYYQKKLQDNVVNSLMFLSFYYPLRSKMATARWRIADARLIVGIWQPSTFKRHSCGKKNRICCRSELLVVSLLLLAAGWFKDTKRMYNVARRSGCAARVASERLKNLCQDLMQRFVDGDDDFRNCILKLIPSVPKGSWIVRRSALNAACLLGKSVDCNYLRGHSCLEIDVDISSSTVAKCVLGLVICVITTLVVRHDFSCTDILNCAQGNTPEELPERLIGAVRFFSFRIIISMRDPDPFDPLKSS
ncbi:hypothetical protein CASFOL_036709 [Castilleja foliolosa]|uniref:Protein ENHANCED DISEASE RESISTANCE 2 C-terminal domain-containing protein n=1 Tax=Castilleja foliolosa TaxID=1961234 RepID=A0ABD3BPE0_9LAMI